MVSRYLFYLGELLFRQCEEEIELDGSVLTVSDTFALQKVEMQRHFRACFLTPGHFHRSRRGVS